MNLPSKMPALDGLRAVAIMLVLLAHTMWGLPGALYIFQSVHDVHALALPPLLTTIGLGGWHGVCLFFVISAFTLTVSAARDDRGLRSYAIRRIARIAPGFWLAGIVYLSLCGLGPTAAAPNGIHTADLLLGFSLLGVWQDGAALAVVPGGWSVSSEAAFYVALPFVLWLVNGRLWRAVALTAAAFLLAQWRIREAYFGSYVTVEFMHRPLEQLPVFLAGVTAALVAMRWRLPRLPGLAPALLCAAICLPLVPFSQFVIGRHLVFALLAAPMVALYSVRPSPILASAPMRYVGTVSYSIYLTHFALLLPVFRVAAWLSPAEDWRTLAVYFSMLLGASVAVSSITYRYVEKPWNDAARKTPPRVVVA